MLAPDSRRVAIDLLRPPAGYRLDHAVLTTYSLDLEALLALPLAVIAHAEGGVDELLDDPLLLIEALREAGDRIHVFVDIGGIAVPRSERAIYALLEDSVHPVRAPNGGAFHPKLWIARFVDDAGSALLRIAVLSRNLTFDRSWDIALASERTPGQGPRLDGSGELGDLLRALPAWSTELVPPMLRARLEALATEVERTEFPAPEGFSEAIAFSVLGLPGVRQRPWLPRTDGLRLLAVAPFANRTALDALASITSGQRTLVSRQEVLDALHEDALALWHNVFTLADAAVDESDDESAQRPSGLHAKFVAIEHGWDTSWFVGSANLTAAAFLGRNVEVMAAITGRKGRKAGRSGVGIERFFDAGFGSLCEPYHPAPPAPEHAALVEAQRLLEQVRDRLLQDGVLSIRCGKGDKENGEWVWTLVYAAPLQDDVAITVWPVSLSAGNARPLAVETTWNLPVARLTAFVALRLSVQDKRVDDLCFTLKVPAKGLPEGRMAQVLRTLIDSPERFLQFLRALLGGLDGLLDWSMGENGNSERGDWRAGLGAETLLEDLMRVASRDPVRLQPVKQLIDDLRETAEGRAIVPDDLYAIWRVIEEVLSRRAGDAAPRS